MACLAASYIPFENEFFILCTQLLFLLFFGGALMTPLTGIMLHSVIPEAKHVS
jgi:hypothetical protein